MDGAACPTAGVDGPVGADPAARKGSLDALLAEHEAWLTVERGLAPNSLAAYRRDLRRYAEFLRASGLADPGSIDEADIAAYVVHLRSLVDDDGRPVLSTASIARGLVAVRSFHRFCVAEDLLPTDPSAEIGSPRVPQGIPKALDEEEVSALLESVAGDDPAALRDRAILEMLYATGVRISELVGLDVGDVSLDDGLARVMGKGGRERMVPVGRIARGALRSYLDSGRSAHVRPRKTAGTHGDAVFLNSRGGRLSRQSCWKIVRTAGDRVGLGERLSPHVLRHSCATHMLDHGADIRVVQELLGHASVSTTQVYTKVSPSRLQAAYDSAHPRAHRT